MKKIMIVMTVFMLLSVPAIVWSGGQKEAASGSGAEAEEEKIELTWFGWNLDHIDDIEERYFDPFEEMYPNVEMKTEVYPWGEYETKALTLIQSGQYEDALGVGTVFAAALDKAGGFEDLTPYIEEAPQAWKDGIYENGFVRHKGRIIGLQFAATPYSFVYNKKAFADKGLEPPTNFDEFRETLKEFRDPANNKYGAVLTFFKGHANVFTWLYMAFYMTQKGGYMLDENGMPAFDSPLGVEAVDYFVGLVEDGLVVPHPESIDHNTNRELFISGQVPITIDGAFMKGLTAERNPDLDIGFLHLDDVTGGHTTGGGFWAVGAGSEHKQMAFNFIQFLTTEEMARKYFLESGQAPFFDVYDHPEIQNDEFARVSGEILADPDTKPMPILPQSTELQKILVEQVQQVLLEGKDTAQALSEAADGWREIIEANR